MTTSPPSVYPRELDDLMPAARTLALDLGEVPSRNRLMKDLRIGAPKAQALREELLAEQAQPDPWEFAETPESETAPAPGPEPDDIEINKAPEEIDFPLTEPAQAQPEVIVAPGPIEFVEPVPTAPAPQPVPQAAGDGHPAAPARSEGRLRRVLGRLGEPRTGQPEKTPDPGPAPEPERVRPVVVWPVLPLALPAFVALWAGWVDLGRLTGFGEVNLLPGIAKPGGWATIDSAITLPIGMETYAAYALYVWLSGRVPQRAKRFAMWSAIVSLVVGAGGQVAYHLLIESGRTSAPWQITTLVSCLPVAVLGMGAALAHLVREQR